MAISCGSGFRLSLPCMERRWYRILAVTNVSNLQRLTPRYGFAFPEDKRALSVERVQVSCFGDHKTPPVNCKSWENLVLESKTPVLVEFYARWCGPCRMVHRVIDEIATEYSGRLKCFVIDADKDFKLADTYDIQAVPMVLLFKNGEKRHSILGTMPKHFYVDAIETLLAS